MAYYRCTGNSGGSLKVRTAQGDIASFETNLPEPYQSVLVNVLATGGNGSPDSPNPINGYSSANITRCGVNLVNPDTLATGWLNADGTVDSSYPNYKTTDFIPVTPSSTLGITATGSSRCKFYDANKQPITSSFDGNIGGISGQTFTVTSNTYYIRKTVSVGNVATFAINTDGDTSYAPYTGNTYTIAFGQTVYGGVLDVKRGKLKPCIEYPSYNGETLSGRWLSSEATYVEGTTPPIGSQVVSLDDYGTDIDLTPVQVRALVGENNVFADCGQTEVKYLKAGD